MPKIFIIGGKHKNMPEIDTEKHTRAFGGVAGYESQRNRKPLIVEIGEDGSQKIIQRDQITNGAAALALMEFGRAKSASLVGSVGVNAVFESSEDSPFSLGAVAIGVGRQRLINEDGKFVRSTVQSASLGIAGARAQQAKSIAVELGGLSASVSPQDKKDPKIGSASARILGLGFSSQITRVVSEARTIATASNLSLGHASASSRIPNSQIAVGHPSEWTIIATTSKSDKARAGAQIAGLFFSRSKEDIEAQGNRRIVRNGKFSAGAGVFSAHGETINVQMGPISLTSA